MALLGARGFLGGDEFWNQTVAGLHKAGRYGVRSVSAMFPPSQVVLCALTQNHHQAVLDTQV